MLTTAATLRIAGIVVALGIVGGIAYALMRSPDTITDAGNNTDGVAESRSAATNPFSNTPASGSVDAAAPVAKTSAPLAEAAPQASQALDSTSAEPAAQTAMDSAEAMADRLAQQIGRTPAIDPANPAAQPVIEALRTGTHPERLSPVHPPTPFNAETYRNDPAAYVANVEPGRVFDVAAPAEDVPVLTALVDRQQEITQGQSTPLRVRTAPGAPVSFTSLDLGIFKENGLSAITVAADADGVATVHLFAPTGTYGEITTLAGSPLASGQIRFLTMVELPTAKP